MRSRIVVFGSILLAIGAGISFKMAGFPFVGGMVVGGVLVWWLADFLAFDAFARALGW